MTVVSKNAQTLFLAVTKGCKAGSYHFFLSVYLDFTSSAQLRTSAADCTEDWTTFSLHMFILLL